MAQLAIKGHATRDNEVVELLEMLGGKNVRNYACNLIDYAYSINGQGIIDWYIPHPNSPLVIYTLEEFLEKFPYKIGDKVKIPNCVVACRVTNMIWNGIDMEYKTTNSEETFFDDELQPYKEETMEGKYNIEEYLKVWEETEKGLEVVVNDRFELKEDNGKFYIIKKQLQYPKTYEECAQILLERASVRNDIGHKGDLLIALQRLLVCRDAYWKIAGEQMGLGEPWKPDWLNTEQDKFVLYTHNNVICLNRFVLGHNVLAFPTAEMRDAFLENFKELIESCKELL